MKVTFFGAALLLAATSSVAEAQVVRRTNQAPGGPYTIAVPQPIPPVPRVHELFDSNGRDIAVDQTGVVNVVGADSTVTTPRVWLISMPDPADPGQDVINVEDKFGEGLIGAIDADALVCGGNSGPVTNTDGAYWMPGDPNANIIPDLVPGAAAIVNGIAMTPSGIVAAGLESSTTFIWDAVGGTRPLLDLDGSLGSGGTGRVAKDGTIVGFGPDPLTGNNVGLLWVNEVPQALDDPTGIGTITFAISPDGTNAGGSSTDSTGSGQPSIWRDEAGMLREVLLDENGSPFFFPGEVVDIEDDGFALVNAFYLNGDQVGVWHPSFGSLNSKPLSVFLAEQGVILSGEVFVGGIASAWDGETYHLLLGEQGGNAYYVSCSDLN